MNEREITLLDHLTELRRRVFISVLALLIGTGVAFFFWKDVLRLLKWQLRDLNDGAGVTLQATQFTETISASLNLALLGGFILAFPVILYQVIRFVAPGLTGKERRSLLAFLPGGLLAFIGGIAFSFFVLIPPAMYFLQSFGADVIDQNPRVSSFLTVMTRLLFAMGLAFETPLIMYFLAHLGVVTARAFSRFRRYWIIIAFVLGAIITPTTDPFNQAIFAGTLIVLYEVGILLARLAARGRQRPTSEAAPGLSGSE